MNRLAYWFQEHPNKRHVDLASFAGTSEAQVKNWCNGSSANPKLDTALKIAEFTGMSTDMLFEEVDNKGRVLAKAA